MGRLRFVLSQVSESRPFDFAQGRLWGTQRSAWDARIPYAHPSRKDKDAARVGHPSDELVGHPNRVRPP
jgi:hypothetical protein